MLQLPEMSVCLYHFNSVFITGRTGAHFRRKSVGKDSLDLDFRELTGIEENKPFECVGTRREVLVALKTFIARGGKSLLTERYKETIEAAPGELDEMLSEWVSENQVPEHFLEILKDFMNRA